LKIVITATLCSTESETTSPYVWLPYLWNIVRVELRY